MIRSGQPTKPSDPAEPSPLLRLNAATLSAATAVLVAMAFLAYRQWSEYLLIESEMRQAAAIDIAVAGLLDGLLDSETGQRGFLLTGEERYLEPYQSGRAEVSTQLAALNQLLRPDPALARLNTLADQKMAELAETIELRRQKGVEAALEVVGSDRGKRTMDEIRGICSRLRRQQQLRGAERNSQAVATARESMLVAVIGSLFLFSLLLAGHMALRRGAVARERALAEAHAARESLRTTLASIGDAVIATDAKGRIVFSNSVAQNLLRRAEQDLVGRDLDEVFKIINEETRAKAESPVAKVLREGTITGLANHTILIAADGTEIPIDDSGAPIRREDGSIAGTVLVFRDITDRRTADREQAATNVKLAQANEDLKRFAYIASHDLQEPLRMISTYTQLLLRSYPGPLEGDVPIFVTNIVQGTERMRDLLADLLAYTELSASPEVPSEVVDLNTVLGQVLENLKTSIEESGAIVSFDRLPAIYGYRAHFVSLFQNLIGNAIKYRSEKPPRIHISVEERGGDLLFAVVDNGMGIDPRYHRQIFEPFKRLHGSKIPGTGIGLAICQRIVERYGGRIWVESALDQGAMFYASLPANAMRSESAGEG